MSFVLYAVVERHAKGRNFFNTIEENMQMGKKDFSFIKIDFPSNEMLLLIFKTILNVGWDKYYSY